MKTFKQNLGKVSITIDKNPWDDSKCYDRLVVVRPEGEFKTYISRKPVPEGIELSNIDYWLPFTALDASYVAALEELIANKLNIDGSNAQNFELDHFGANRIYRQSQGQETPGFGIIIPTISNDAETFLISSDKQNFVHSASYDYNSKRINFYGNLNNILCYIDATDFIKDGMIDNVYIANGKLIITFNTEAGKEDIEIPLTDIFNPNNYYTKVEVDQKLTLKTDLTQHQVLAAQVTTILGYLDNKENKFFVVNCNISSENVITTNTTYDELNTAFTQEKHCVLKLSSVYHSIFFISDLTKSGNVFTARGLYNNRHFIVTIYKNSSDETIVTYDIKEIQDKLVNGTNIASINNQSLLNGGNINVQAVINALNKLSADVIDDSSATNKFVTSSDKTLWNTVTEKAPLPFVVKCGIDPSDEPFVRSTLDEIWEAYQNGKDIRVKFSKAGGIAFEDDATLLLDGSRNCVAHTVHNGTHYVITIYDDNGVTKLFYVETYDNPEIVNLTDGEHSSGYYEDLMRTVDVLKLDTPQIFLYTAYNNNHIATTAICFSTCTNTETPTTNAVVKQTLFLGTYKSIRTLSNIISDSKYQVVDNWAQIIDVKQSDLDAKVSRAGSSMSGDLNLNDHELQVRANRNGIKFVNNETGVLVGNGNMNTTIQSGNANLKHRKGSTDYNILDTSNVKTVNGNPIYGSGDINIGIINYEGVVSQTQTWTVVNPPLPRRYTMSNIVRGIIPKSFVDLVEPFGAIFNQTTGYFEFNGLTDISYEEMRAIYNHGAPRLDGGYFFYSTTIRTNIFCQTYVGDIAGNWLARDSKMEVINLYINGSAYPRKINNGTYPFYSCPYLKEIIGPITPVSWTYSGAGASPFKLCYNLESLQFKGMLGSTDFGSSTLLTLDSVVYMVQNAANTSAITITLHSTAYQRCVDDTNTYEYEGTTYTGIIALATAKDITIASA